MHEKIDEIIEAIVFFTKKGMKLHSFIWKHRRYPIDKVNLVHRIKHGADFIYFYSVSSGSDVYKLSFSIMSLKWRLIELYTE